MAGRALEKRDRGNVKFGPFYLKRKKRLFSLGIKGGWSDCLVKRCGFSFFSGKRKTCRKGGKKKSEPKDKVVVL